jgi:geranylgeranyl pyrophosphate synthase
LSKDEELRRLYGEVGTNEAFVSQVVERLDRTGSREFAEQNEKQYADSAIAHLEAVSPDGGAGAALFQITGRLLNRTF